MKDEEALKTAKDWYDSGDVGGPFGYENRVASLAMLLRETRETALREVVCERGMLRREIVAIEEALMPDDDSCPLVYAKDVEHYITCHADTLPQVTRRLAKTLLEIQAAGRERHDKEDPG
jgi:hypothetical protein